MCLIIAKSEGSMPCRSTFFEAAKFNDDAMGVAYFRDDGHMSVHKWLHPKKRQIEKAWKIIERNKDRQVLIHFRMTTHGANCYSNAHPFPLGGDAVLAHNGIIPGYSDKVKSDTALFVETVMSPMYRDFGTEFLNNAHSLVGKEIGMSKLATLHRNDGFFFVNEGLGAWRDGHWYSNAYHFPYKGYGGRGRVIEYDSKSLYDYDPSMSNEYFESCNRMRYASPEDIIDDFVYASKWEICAECGLDTTQDGYCHYCKVYTTPHGIIEGNEADKARREHLAAVALNNVKALCHGSTR